MIWILSVGLFVRNWISQILSKNPERSAIDNNGKTLNRHSVPGTFAVRKNSDASNSNDTYNIFATGNSTPNIFIS